tara:strand:- start:706 stop:1086 length:381 start_codon:yes stop_codon:yes gene_type:complete
MLNVKTRLGWDEVKGITVIADQDIKQGDFVTIFDPSYDIIFEKTYIDHMPESQRHFIDNMAYEYEYGEDFKYILPFGHEPFMNHATNPNVDEYGRASRNIKSGEELTCDYVLMDSRCVVGSEPWLI